MKYIILILISLCFISPAMANENQFFETLYDVPVMDGLEELPDMALSFDKMGGRISEAGAIAKDLSPQEIMTFYAETLSQMGWRQKSNGVFIRQGEILKIMIEPMPIKEVAGRHQENHLKSNTYIVVRFALQPQQAKSGHHP